eukprot:777307-Rhodomonas_salina.1
METLVINCALFDPTGDINLIAMDDVNATDWDINLSNNDNRCVLYKYVNDSRLPIVQVMIEKVGKLHTLLIDNYAVPAVLGDATCFNTHCGNLSLEELFHQRMAHVPLPKLAKMSHLVDGLP